MRICTLWSSWELVDILESTQRGVCSCRRQKKTLPMSATQRKYWYLELTLQNLPRYIMPETQPNLTFCETAIHATKNPTRLRPVTHCPVSSSGVAWTSNTPRLYPQASSPGIPVFLNPLEPTCDPRRPLLIPVYYRYN